MNSSTFTLWTCTFPVKEVSGLFLLLPWFTEIPVFYANSADPDQTPHNAASDLGLHCLPMPLLWDARLKWVQPIPVSLKIEYRLSRYTGTSVKYSLANYTAVCEET